jgi:hypothetical protein
MFCESCLNFSFPLNTLPLNLVSWQTFFSTLGLSSSFWFPAIPFPQPWLTLCLGLSVLVSAGLVSEAQAQAGSAAHQDGAGKSRGEGGLLTDSGK